MEDAYTLMMDLKLYTGAWVPKGRSVFTVICGEHVADGSKWFSFQDILLTLPFRRRLLFGIPRPIKHPC